MHFPVSNIDVPIWMPPLVAFVISFFTSMGGISGAVFLLPFQVSVLGFSSPNVSSTNFVFNIFAIPGGVYKYLKEGRIAWSILWVTLAGTLPGLFIGTWLRTNLFLNPVTFKVFAGCVLLYISIRMVWDLFKTFKSTKGSGKENLINKKSKSINLSIPSGTKVNTLSFSIKYLELEFSGQNYKVPTIGLFVLSFIVGIVGGTYGIGGGAIIAPFLVSIFGLPVYAIAGVSLIGTFVTSIFGVIFYSIIKMQPDWLLGFLFGLGGFFGIYLGASCQKYVPQKYIKAILILVLGFLAIKYITGYFLLR